MAGTVDRTFVQALAIESDRRAERAGVAASSSRAIQTAFPLASGQVATVPATTGSPATPGSTAVSLSGEAASDEVFAQPTVSRSLFGVERRAPRGAFLWPAATTAALGLNAAAPDGELSMSVAALELLAAQAVAELGTYAAFADRGALTIGADGGLVFAPQAQSGSSGGYVSAAAAAGGEGVETDVLSSAAAMVPAARRDKFQALYVALSQSPAGRAWSPAARAARALALAGRGDESVSARERAQVAWDVLPVVFGPSLDGDGQGDASLSTGEVAVRQARRREELRSLDPIFVDGRPGLGMLSSRAGEALGSYVAPSAMGGSSGATGFAGSPASTSSSASSAASREPGALLRVPTAAQELVQTGRPAGRFGGGEVEIPPWFEAAARKMLEDRPPVADGPSLADLTLVQTAAPQQIAASSRHDGGTATSSTPTPTGGAGAEKEKVDIEKLASEVYREVLTLMDVARERNGEPYL